MFCFLGEGGGIGCSIAYYHTIYSLRHTTKTNHLSVYQYDSGLKSQEKTFVRFLICIVCIVNRLCVSVCMCLIAWVDMPAVSSPVFILVSCVSPRLCPVPCVRRVVDCEGHHLLFIDKFYMVACSYFIFFVPLELSFLYFDLGMSNEVTCGSKWITGNNKNARPCEQ